jgi:hypothetical protein
VIALLLALTVAWAQDDAVEETAATDQPHLYVREMVAVAGRPGGAITDAVVEGRTPVLRFGDPISNMTFVGAGARLAVSPAHIDMALRSTIQLIDILPITVELVHTRYFDGPFAPIGYEEFRSTEAKERDLLYAAGFGFATGGFTAIVNPTFQIKLGQLVAISSWTVSWVVVKQPDGVATPMLFDPYRNLLIGWNDRLLEHTSAALWEPLDGQGQALLRLGAALRGQGSKVTSDNTLTLGPLGMWKPGVKPGVPTFMLLVAAYLRDPDFTGPVPYTAFVMTWEMPAG